MRAPSSVLLMTLVGAGAGALVTWWFVGRAARGEPQTASIEQPASTRGDPEVAALRERVASLEARMLHSGPPPSASSPSEGERSDRPPASGPSSEAVRVRAEEQDAQQEALHVQLLAAHDREPLDVHWSREKQAEIEKVFQPMLGTLHVGLNRVDCRSTTCVVGFEWPQKPDARVDLQALLHTPLAACAQRITLPRSESQPYRAQLIIDCSSN